MAESIPANLFTRLGRGTPILDVRSPGEFRQGHIPGAASFPLFDDQQRATVGVAYKHNGQRKAILKGLELVGPRMSEMAEQMLERVRLHERDSTRRSEVDLLIHCWRGGMRSRSVAWLAQQVGLRVQLLEGGYKAYRRYVLDRFTTPFRFRVISGMTGAGKTEVLQRLAEADQQVLDLEGLANHRGSAFGHLGTQPTVEQFENNLEARLSALDVGKVIWVEDEARSIGRVSVPRGLFQQYRKAPAIFLDVPRLVRARRLAADYGDCPAEDLKAGIQEIRKRLGGQHVNRAIAALDQGNWVECADIVLEYYDKAYQRSQDANERSVTESLPVSDPGDSAIDVRLIRWASEVGDA